MKTNYYKVYIKPNHSGLTRHVFVFGNNRENCIKCAEIVGEGSFSAIEKIGELDTENYKTGFDGLQSHIESGYPDKQYNRGFNLDHTMYDYVYIRRGGAWGAWGRLAVITSCETIGLHSHTKKLLEGFLAGDWSIIDYREENRKFL
jgi:hypothetical protein